MKSKSAAISRFAPSANSRWLLCFYDARSSMAHRGALRRTGREEPARGPFWPFRVLRQIDRGTELHFRTPMMQLQDPQRIKSLIVTLAEPTPVLEAAMLQDDLRRAGIEPWAWIVNNSLAAARPTSPLLRQRARTELPEIEAVATRHARRYAVVPMLTDEPVGIDRLLKLVAGQRPAVHGV